MYCPIFGQYASLAVFGAEGPADSFITAVWVAAGAAYLYSFCHAFLTDVVELAVFHVTAYAVPVILIHFVHSFGFMLLACPDRSKSSAGIISYRREQTFEAIYHCRSSPFVWC